MGRTRKPGKRLSAIGRMSAFVAAVTMGSGLLMPGIASAAGVDSTFGSGGVVNYSPWASSKSDGTSSVVQSDGKLVVVGSNTGLDGITRMTFVRFNTNGSVDTTFNAGGSNNVTRTGHDLHPTDAAIAPDGKIVAVGYSTVSGGNDEPVVVRLNPNGSLDNTFDGDGMRVIPIGSISEHATSVAVQSDGEVVIGGMAGLTWDGSSVGTDDQDRVWKLTTSGSFDTTFNGSGWSNLVFAPETGVDHKVNDLSVDPINGNILVLDDSWGLGKERATVVRISATGASVGSNAVMTGTVNSSSESSFHFDSLAVRSDGHWFVSGSYFGGFTISGETSAYSPGSYYVMDNTKVSLSVRSDNKLTVSYVPASGAANAQVLRINPAPMSMDTTFGTGGSMAVNFGSSTSVIRSLATAPDDSVYGVGQAGNANIAAVKLAP